MSHSTFYYQPICQDTGPTVNPTPRSWQLAPELELWIHQESQIQRPIQNIVSPRSTNHPLPSLNMASPDAQYRPKDAVGAGVTGTMITGTAGLAVSAIQNTLSKSNVGAWGVFTKTGGTIAVFGRTSRVESNGIWARGLIVD